MTENELKDRQKALYKQYRATGCRKSHAELIATFNGIVYKLSARMLKSGSHAMTLCLRGFLRFAKQLKSSILPEDRFPGSYTKR